jgi:protein gp37
MAELLSTRLRWVAGASHIWWGVSVEDRQYGLPRIADLRATPAAVKFLSIEPLLEDLGTLDLTGIHWVIVGGESGPGARPMKAEWVRSIRDQCAQANLPFFFKQWGTRNKKCAGRVLDGKLYDEFPSFKADSIPA